MSKVLIESLSDLNTLRTAPELSQSQTQTLESELTSQMNKSQWFTVGIMAPSSAKAIRAMRNIEAYFKWPEMKLMDNPTAIGPVFLKANQSSAEIRVRVEQGLGEGILISGHDQDPNEPSTNWGPLPLDFFDNLISTKNSC